MNIDTKEGIALLSVFHDVRRKIQDAISKSNLSRPEESATLKRRFHTDIWPNLYPAYQNFVNELVRYCCGELKKRRIDCLVLGRAKTAISIKESLNRREQRHGNPFRSFKEIFDAMHDLAGSLIAIQHADDLNAVNRLISERFQATKPPKHWTRDRQPGQLWDSRFGSYESYNHHVTLEEISNQPTITFEIQVTTQSNFTYNLFAHDWCYKEANGPMSRGDEMVMDILHGAAIIVEVGGQYMRERQEENYNLVQAIKLSEGAEERQFESGNLNLLLGRLRSSGYNSFTKVERVASQFRPRDKEDAPGYEPMDQLLGIISQPFKRHRIVPFRQNEDFVGRESTLRKLLERIPPSAKRNKRQMNVIEGLGGVGKTQVALEVAYQAYKRFPDRSVFWVPVINMASFENAYREIGKALEVDRLEEDDVDMKSLVKTALEENAGDWLLVIDNADDPELLFGRAGGPAIRDYLPYSRQGSILLTTRNHDITVGFDVQEENICTVQNLEEAEAMRVLQKNLKGSQIQYS
ncbi:P-loop containing nucleoside triphosphate hydrolase protein [Annulohypoxylon stygium]|nr:P-loop containing nucleoside triphosphate hydrolase protein [Annulohypoxylon stygium]